MNGAQIYLSKDCIPITGPETYFQDSSAFIIVIGGTDGLKK